MFGQVHQELAGPDCWALWIRDKPNIMLPISTWFLVIIYVEETMAWLIHMDFIYSWKVKEEGGGGGGGIKYNRLLPAPSLPRHHIGLRCS